jgi:hypothetical protein
MHKLKLQFVSRKDINENAWNHVVRHSRFSRIYAYTWFLDAMTDKSWTGLVIGEYEAVFPILIKKKLFIPYITTPHLCQQLGLFTVDESNTDSYLKPIQTSLKSYLKTELTLNPGSIFPTLCTTKTNHILPLNESYESLKKDFNRNTIRNITAALKSEAKLIYTQETDIFLDFVYTHEPSRSLNQIYHPLQNLINYTFEVGNGNIIVAFVEESLAAAAFVIEDEERIYFLVCASSEKGKDLKLMYLIIDFLIQKYANTQKIFDFTGSNISSIARRNLGFGAIAEEYYFLKMKVFN